jgi:ferredoxin
VKRRIIEIDEIKCNGCGLCADACHEGAIGVIDGKAKLLRDDYCDGLGNCLPVCPAGAIAFVEREAAEYKEYTARLNQPKIGSRAAAANTRNLCRSTVNVPVKVSELKQWPIQIKLVNANAPYFGGANLLVAADCAAYARANFHSEFMCGKITLIGCPKLDGVEYTGKLTEIITGNDLKSLTVVRMEVPCCGKIEQAAVCALKNSGKFMPWRVATLGINGELKDE